MQSEADNINAARLPGTSRALPCLDRREFLAQSTLLALGTLMVAACAVPGDGITGPQSVNVTVKVADYPALANVGGIAKLSGISSPVAVVRATDTTYRAFSLVCPHQGTTVQLSGTTFRCPNHGATFNANGQWIGGQPASNLHEFTVTPNSADGTITVS